MYVGMDGLCCWAVVMLWALVFCQPFRVALGSSAAGSPPTSCAKRTVQLVQHGAVAAEALAGGDPLTAWRSLPPVPPVEEDGCQLEEHLRAELHNLVAATAMRVAAMSLPPPDLPAESMTTLAAAALSSSLQIHPDAAEPNWNAALLAGMAEGATGTWDQTPPLEGPPLLHSAAHSSLFEGVGRTGSPEFSSGLERLSNCLRHLRRRSIAARSVHGGVLADGGTDLGLPSALWAFATTVGPATTQRVLPSDPQSRQMLSLILATDLPVEGSGEAEAARIHAELVSDGIWQTPSLGPTSQQFFVSRGVRASLERVQDVSSCATVHHQPVAYYADDRSTISIRGVCEPASSYMLRMGPTKRGYWWRAHAIPSLSSVDRVSDYTVRWTADGAFGAAWSPVAVVTTINSQDTNFGSFMRSIDDAAQHARSLRTQMYPAVSRDSQDWNQVVVVVQAIPGAPLNQSRWRTDLRATMLVEIGLPDAADRLSPTGFLRAVISSGILSKTLDNMSRIEDVNSIAAHNDTAIKVRKAPLLVWVGSEGIDTTLPIDFLASLEQYVVYGKQIYCPVGTAANVTPLESGASVIGAKLADMRSAVMHPGMEYWRANSAWVGSESWALLRTLTYGMGMQVARPREHNLQFAAANNVHNGAEFGTLPSWWSAAARTGLCLSDPIGKSARRHHHPGLLSRVSFQGVQYYDSTGLPALAASHDELSIQLMHMLSREAAANSRVNQVKCNFHTDSAGWLVGSRPHQATDGPITPPRLRCASLPVGQNRPIECRVALLNLMISASAALSASGVIHWLDFGTLLGAIREHDIIAHTNDVEMASLLSKKADILAMRSGLLDCGVQMQNRAHNNDRNGVGVVDYIELSDQRYVSEDGTPEVKLDISLRMFMNVHRLTDGDARVKTSMLVDPTDNFANTIRSAVSASEILPLQRCEVSGVGFPCPNDGIVLVKRYYGDDCLDVVKRDVHVAANGDGNKHVDSNIRLRSEL